MEEKYWKQFENSGKIEDYLSFVSSTGRGIGNVPYMRDVSDMEGALSAAGVSFIGDVNSVEKDSLRGV